MAWKTKGMNQDMSVSAFNPEFAFENMNLRLSTNDGNTMMSWVNEKGTLKLAATVDVPTGYDDSNDRIQGYPIGTAVLNHHLVIFTTTNIAPTAVKIDRIYRVDNIDTANATASATLLFEGSLDFNIDYPIETLVSFESEDIQKVYWTDGNNQPRVINIAPGAEYKTADNKFLNTQFDFVPELKLEESVTVNKLLGAGGAFASGVIQYAFTYYYLHGQETNIFYTTPLLYVSPGDRGGRPDEKVDNAFQITIDNVDTSFDYLRIYSIHRTSLNATPFVKRVQDVSLENLGWADEGNHGKGKRVSYTDTGYSGDSVDPTELLYKGGENIKALTLEQKDGTLFLGNIEQTREDRLKLSGLNVVEDDKTRTVTPAIQNNGSYTYGNQLSNTASKPCGSFKRGNTYRCGVQFQHKSGRWSSPVFIKDVDITKRPTHNGSTVDLPRLKGTIPQDKYDYLNDLGYKKARAVVVFPQPQDRKVICQGVANPCIYMPDRIKYQSSWFFRPYTDPSKLVKGYDCKDDGSTIGSTTDGSVAPVSLWNMVTQDGNGKHWSIYNQRIPYFKYSTTSDGGIYDEGSPEAVAKIPFGPIRDKFDPNNNPVGFLPDQDIMFMRAVEIEGAYSLPPQVTFNWWTVNTPEAELGDEMATTDFTNSTYQGVGWAKVTRTLSDIDIQTETPTISKGGAGFIHHSFDSPDTYGIVSGVFYDDYLVDDSSEDADSAKMQPWAKQKAPVKFMVYPWQMGGSLNNDMNRPADKGVASAILKKKVISNLRFATTALSENITKVDENNSTLNGSPQLFSSDDVSILKFQNGLYYGNVDTMLTPKTSVGTYFVVDNITGEEKESISHIKYLEVNFSSKGTSFTSDNWGKTFSNKETAKNGRSIMLYKKGSDDTNEDWLGIDDDLGDAFVDLVLKKTGVRMKYKSSPHIVLNVKNAIYDHLEEYSLPIFEVCKTPTNMFGGDSEDALRENVWIPCGEPVKLNSAGDTIFYYEYGDTYFQRYDCLKTYPFTPEDTNQIVEIGSFMLETYINIDGRHDRNRGQQNNLNMTPQNFNLLNPVYSQVDNFFSYKIMPEDYYKTQYFPNQLTWTLTKESGSDVDKWTNLTLASVLELDGDKGQVTSLQRLNDQLICFQDTSISQILYNENTQISTTEGVPIEIANSGKVQGKRYLTDSVGCSNKWSICNTPAGIYFMDSINKGIYLFNGQVTNLSGSMGFNAWCKENILNYETKWNPSFPETGYMSSFVTYYDKLNQDILFIGNSRCLAFSEKFQAFTSFYSYNHSPYFCNFDGKGIWLRAEPDQQMAYGVQLYQHQAGEYNMFFGDNNFQPYWMKLVGNPEPQMDKIFTNLEFRACMLGSEGNEGIIINDDRFSPYLPFDTLEATNEYQQGRTNLQTKFGHALFKHGESSSALIRKFRIWRCDIPRNNLSTSHKTDRMRNPWLYLTLKKDVPNTVKAEIHDIVMTYYT